MRRKVLVALVVLGTVLVWAQAYCEEKDFAKERIVEIATTAVKGAGFNAQEATIVYDEGGKLWAEKIGEVAFEDKSPNHGILKQGFLKNYRVVFFDFKEPIKDVWVFIDKDTGEVLIVHQEE